MIIRARKNELGSSRFLLKLRGVDEFGDPVTRQLPSATPAQSPSDLPCVNRCFDGEVLRSKGIRQEPQFTVDPPQHCLYFFPEPHGQGSLRPTLGMLRRGSEVRPLVPAAMCAITSSRRSGLIGSDSITSSLPCSGNASSCGSGSRPAQCSHGGVTKVAVVSRSQ